MSLESLEALFPNKAQFDTMNSWLKSIVEALAGGDGNHSEDDISTIQRNVALGLGPDYYPVGTIIHVPEFVSATATYAGTGITGASVTGHAFLEAIGTAKHAVYEFKFDGAVWDLDGHHAILADYGVTATGTPAAGDEIAVTVTANDREFVVLQHNGYNTIPQKPHMTIVLYHTIYGKPLDGAEAFYYCAEALPAGAYTFNIPAAAGSWPAGDYTFTLANAAAAGSILKISGVYSTALTSLSVQVYASATAATAAETAAISSGSTGTSLGAFGTELNHIQRVSYGSNNYAQSNIRQWLNSDAASGSWFVKQTQWDRQDPVYANLNGWLYNYGEDFKAALVRTEVPCITNTIFETGGYTTSQQYNLHDKVFLLSRPEVYNSYESNALKDGSVLDFYKNAVNADRIKYDISNTATPRSWWLRTPHVGNAYGSRFVYTSGSLDNYGAYGGIGASPACNIG